MKEDVGSRGWDDFDLDGSTFGLRFIWIGIGPDGNIPHRRRSAFGANGLGGCSG